MALNFHSSSNAPRHLVDELRATLAAAFPELAELERAVLRLRLADEHQHLASERLDAEKARLYFNLYTLPLLESAGLLKPQRAEEAIFWATIQLCLGLHLRYADYALDGDPTKLSVPQLARRAQAYLARAQTLLWESGRAWTPQQNALFGQYLAYECEVEEGWLHDFSSLWRRVSPLCVVGETYLAESISAAALLHYRNYLSWSLLLADGEDVMADLLAKRRTPITILINEHSTGDLGSLQALPEIIAHTRDFLGQQAGRLKTFWGAAYPVSRMIVEQRQASIVSRPTALQATNL